MSSILTNTSAMTALQTLKNINSNLETTQSQISTGKKVGSAKDSAAVFAISRVMEADVTAFKSISETLSLSESTIATASNGAKQIGDLLNEIQGKVVTAQDPSVDRGKVQSEIGELVGQIQNIVGSAQFNGVNLLDGSRDAEPFKALASLNRAADGTVTPDNIELDPSTANLSTESGFELNYGAAIIDGSAATATAFKLSNGATGPAEGFNGGLTTAPGDPDTDTAGAAATATLGLNGATDNSDTIAIGDFGFQQTTSETGGTTALNPDDVTGGDPLSDNADMNGVVAGDKITVTIGDVNASYTVQEGNTTQDITLNLASAVSNAVDSAVADVSIGANNELRIQNLDGGATLDVEISMTRASGGLAGLDQLDVTSDAGATAALDDIEDFIQTATNAESQLGTTATRLEIQNDFVSSQIDSFKAGIGTLVDADMEAASARLQALQTQQQLGIQALTIANSSSQNILSLFR